MPPTKPAYPPEFKVEAVKLYRTGSRSLKEVAGDLLRPSKVLQHRLVNCFGGGQVLHRSYLLVLYTSSLVEIVQLT